MIIIVLGARTDMCVFHSMSPYLVSGERERGGGVGAPDPDELWGGVGGGDDKKKHRLRHKCSVVQPSLCIKKILIN